MPSSDSPQPISRRSWLLSSSALLLSGRIVRSDDSPAKPAASATPTASSNPSVRVVGTSDKQQPLDLVGEVLTTAQDGGILLRTPANRLWTLTPEQIKSRKPHADTFKLFTADELKQELQREFPAPFRVIERGDFLFCSDLHGKFLDRCSDLFLRLHKAFEAHWKKLKFPLIEPEQKLAVLVFGNRDDYRKYATHEFNPMIAQTSGYFSVMMNRIVLYDVTAGQGSATPLDRVAEQIATIMHEATHQLAFNRGLQRRLADNPLWLSEGLAMYFETPDLNSRTGWKNVGALNAPRARDLFREFEEHPNLSLATFLGSDAVFHEPRRETGAYALAWGLFFFLMKQKPEQMVKYLTTISNKPPLVWDTPAERIQDFEDAFGPLAEVSPETGKFFQRLGRKL